MIKRTRPYLRIGAEASLAAGDVETAEDYYRKALDRDPENVSVTVHLSNLLIEQERYSEALDLMETKLETGEEDPQLFWNSAKAYNEEEEFDKARENYEKAYYSLKRYTPNSSKNMRFFSRRRRQRRVYARSQALSCFESRMIRKMC
ncbi:MAG: tetratricopeptide repeat protein [Alkalibacterium sp.]|nr:tetratricopeptide repeat protein [Alkalibacterium sp.]